MINSGAPIPAMGPERSPWSARCQARGVLECVVNISEGRDGHVLAALRAAVRRRPARRPHATRGTTGSVFTLVGEEAPRRLATAAVARLDLRRHDGVHPRIGVVDVVPFVPLDGSTMADAVRARDDFAAWMTDTHGVPCLAYGPERTLPEVRRPGDVGRRGHPTAGRVRRGRPRRARGLQPLARRARPRLARQVATPRCGATASGRWASPVGDRVQVSMNLIEPRGSGRPTPGTGWPRTPRWPAPSSSAWCPAPCCERSPRTAGRASTSRADRTIEARLAGARAESGA